MNFPPEFLRAVLDHPDDNGARLICADWLDEHGEHDRASFIRVQVKLVQTPETICENIEEWRGDLGLCTVGQRYVDNPAHSALRRRSRELRIANAVVWWPFDFLAAYDGCGDPTPGSCGVEYRRGFVSAVTCTAADFLAHGDAICAAAPVEEVTLTTMPEWSAGFDFITLSPTRCYSLRWPRVKTWRLPPQTMGVDYGNGRDYVSNPYLPLSRSESAGRHHG